MNISFKGSLVDTQGKAVSSASLQGCIYDKADRVMSVATGRTAANGTFSFASTRVVADTPLPKVAVRLLHKNQWVMLTNQPGSFRDGIADFGRIVLSETASYKVGNTEFYGDNRTATVPILAATTIVQPLRMGTVTPGGAPAPTIDVGSLNREITDLKRAQTDLTKERQTLQVELQNKEKLLTDQSKIVAAKDLEITGLKRVQTDLTKERETLKSQLQSKENLLQTKEIEVQKIRDQILADQSKIVAGKEAEIQRLLNENRNLKQKSPERATLDDIAFASGAQIDSANDRLSEANSSLRIGKISLEIKGVADDAGKAMTLPSAKDIAGVASGLSTLRIDYIPHLRPFMPTIEPAGGPLPKVASLIDRTERAARERLEADGLPYEVYYQGIANDPAKLGRVIHQSPPPDSGVTAGTMVRIIVGKKL